MITRFAEFEEQAHLRHKKVCRAAVKERLVTLWTQFPDNAGERVMFGEEKDVGAPENPLILAISYPDWAAMTAALDSPVRRRSKDVTGEIVAEHFDDRIHNHVTELNDFRA